MFKHPVWTRTRIVYGENGPDHGSGTKVDFPFKTHSGPSEPILSKSRVSPQNDRKEPKESTVSTQCWVLTLHRLWETLLKFFRPLFSVSVYEGKGEQLRLSRRKKEGFRDRPRPRSPGVRMGELSCVKITEERTDEGRGVGGQGQGSIKEGLVQKYMLRGKSVRRKPHMVQLFDQLQWTRVDQILWGKSKKSRSHSEESNTHFEKRKKTIKWFVRYPIKICDYVLQWDLKKD